MSNPIEVLSCYVDITNPPKEIISLFEEIKEHVDEHEFFKKEIYLIVFQEYLVKISEDLSSDESEEMFNAWNEVIELIVEKD